MKPSDPRLIEEPPLTEFTEAVRKARMIAWYRTPVPTAELKRLHERSDWLGAVQTVGYLLVLVGLGVAACVSLGRLPWWGVAGLLFAYGTVAHFLINGVHELGHGTVFRTKGLNSFFCHVLAFPGWINHEMFQASHVRHHRYTLHAPDDLEVVQPVKLVVRDFIKGAVFNPLALWNAVKGVVRIARGRFEGEWELTLFPPGQPEKRHAAMRWARVMLAGHATVFVVSMATGAWLVPVVVSGGYTIGGWLFWLCNNTQHVGLQDDVPDFRLCCRTFTLNPAVRFLYWQMNYHTEHHMYAAVPCYRLAELHGLVKHDLPPTPDGLVAVWREITAILRKQAREPDCRHVPALPGERASVRS